MIQAVQEVKRAIDVIVIIEATGVELRPAGPGRLRGLCPFHPEKTPSFFVFTDRNRWRCFGCGEHGDVIDFIQKARGCSFKDALAILGMDDPQHTAAEVSRLRSERKRREDAKWRERDIAWTLGKAIRVCHAILKRITPDNLDQYAIILQELSVLEHQHQTLIDGDPEDRAALVRELAGLRLLPRRLMFRRNFSFNSTLNKAPNANRMQSGNRS